MDPTQPSPDLILWLLADWRRAALFLGIVALFWGHRYLSWRIGRAERPEVETPMARVLGWISGAVWKDVPGSVKPIFAPMPAGRLPAVDAVPKATDEAPTKPERGTVTPEGGWRSGHTPPQGSSGSYARIDPPKVPGAGVLIIGFLFAFASGCALSGIDKARAEFTRTLKAQTAIQSRWKLQNREHQRKNIERIGVHTVGAEAWQKEWIVKKAPVEEQIRRCQSILEEASDFLLLSDDKRGLATVSNAVACVSAEKDMIGKLLDGGL